ncbi:MAG: hypothetical protein ACYTFA_17265 [Planctomycetota bacterium]|jgi:hypothetical protein
MRNVLMVLQPRAIPDAIRSIAALPIDKVWFRAYKENALSELIDWFIQHTAYDHYLMIADDVIVHESALTAVTRALVEDGLPAVTGWCRVDASVPWANVTKAPLTMKNGRFGEPADYSFYTCEEVRRFPALYLPTWFTGWALTGFTRDLWLRFPFRVNPATGQQSDFEMSWLMQHANIPILCVRDAYMEHLRKTPDALKANWLVDQQEPQMIFEKA